MFVSEHRISKQFCVSTESLINIALCHLDESREKPPSARTITLKSAHHNDAQSKYWITEQEDLYDSAAEEQAATKIQAVFRGHKARKTMKREEALAKNTKSNPEENVDVDLDCPGEFCAIVT